MNNLAELKRALRVGVNVETLTQVGGGAPNSNMAGIRLVKQTQTNGVYLSKTDFRRAWSFMDFGKATDWSFDGNVFTNVDGRSYLLLDTEV